jgi:hypothetical protein
MTPTVARTLASEDVTMRIRLGILAAGFVLALGCGKTPEPAPATPEDEKAAEQRIKDESARETKAQMLERKNKKPNPLDND